MAPTQAKEIFEAQSKSLRELLSDNGLGLYLPPYQRPYGWGKDKVEKLLDDTLHGLKNLGETPDSFTFLGTVITIHDVNHVTVHPIVKPEVPSKVLTVIDGQQRLSSLLILRSGSTTSSVNARGKSSRARAGTTDSARTHLYRRRSPSCRCLGRPSTSEHNFGTTPIYPRLIRAFVDQWARDENHKKYESPIANLIYTYSCHR